MQKFSADSQKNFEKWAAKHFGQDFIYISIQTISEIIGLLGTFTEYR